MVIKNSIKSETCIVDGHHIRNSLRRRIRDYERRYEISSSQMAKVISSGQVRETAEILKWMQSYHVLGLIGRL